MGNIAFFAISFFGSVCTFEAFEDAMLLLSCPWLAVLPLSIEQDMARILSNGTSSKRFSKRRSKSLDNVVVVDGESPSPHCPSPTPSSGVDSNKDSPIQIDNIDSNSIGE